MKYLSLVVVAVVAGVAYSVPGDYFPFIPHRYFGGHSSSAPVIEISRPRFIAQPRPLPVQAPRVHPVFHAPSAFYDQYNQHPIFPGFGFDEDHFDRKKRSVDESSHSRQKRSPGFDFDDDYHPFYRPSVSRVVFSSPVSRPVVHRPVVHRPVVHRPVVHRPVVRLSAPAPSFVRPNPYFYGGFFDDDK